MKGSIDLTTSKLKLGELTFEIQTAVSKVGNEYYKLINPDGIEVGGFKVVRYNNTIKYQGGLTHHVELMFSGYNNSNLVFRRVGFGNKRYRMTKRKASDAAINRMNKKKDK